MNLPVIKKGLFALILTNSLFLHAQIIISQPGSTGAYYQDFNSLPDSGSDLNWINNSTLPGWYSNKTTYSCNSGSSGNGDLYSFGNSSDRALGSIGSVNLTLVQYGVRIRNSTGGAVDRLYIQFTGEQWRHGNNNAAIQDIVFHYSQADSFNSIISTGSPIEPLRFWSPQYGGTGSALNGNADSNRMIIAGIIQVTVPDGEEIFLQWEDIDHSGFDHGLAIDDVVISLHNSPSEFPAVSTLGKLYTGADMILPGNLEIDSLLVLSYPNRLRLGSHILSISGGLQGQGFLSSNGESSLSFSGSGTRDTIFMDQSIPGTSNKLMDLSVNVDSSGITLGNALQINGVLTAYSGKITTNEYLRLVASSSTSYGQISGLGNGWIEGPVFMQMIIPGNNAGWRGFSVPFDTIGFGQLATQTGIYLQNQTNPPFDRNVYIWTESSKSWNAVSSNQNMYGKAYNIYFFDPDNTVIELGGTYSNNDVSVGTLSFTSGASNEEGWHLIGNPYPSSLDWNSLSQPGGVAGIYAIWSVSSGSYLSWNGLTGNAGRYIPPMQSFWVKVNSQVNDYSLQNSARATVNNNFFAKNSSLSNHVILYSSSAQNQYQDRIDLYSTDSSEPESSFPKLMGLPETPNMWLVSNSGSFSILADKEIHLLNQSIALGFRCKNSGVYRFKPELNNIHPDYRVFLEDRKTGTLFSLSEGEYPFEYSSEEPDTGRFFICYRRASTRPTSVVPSMENHNPGYAYSVPGKLIFVYPSEHSQAIPVTLLDNSGKVLGQFLLEGKQIELPVNNPGVYFVRLAVGTSIQSYTFIHY